jgi:S-adenosyl-L-methionine hydrolase (adenosine-forming)
LSTVQDSSRIVTLTTDFGTADPYVGSMKGVMLSIERRLRIVDLSHDLPAHEIVPAALLLREACPRFPAGTIHVAVVDPGVGSPRKPVLLRVGKHFYVGPDNGLFGLLVNDFGLEAAWVLENPRFFLPEVSGTFHGRDIFAPVAAHLAGGVPPETFGSRTKTLVPLEIPACRANGTSLAGQVLWIDRFGNCITNLPACLVSARAARAPLLVKTPSKRLVGLADSYASVGVGEPLAVIGSTGYLEIACNQRRADELLGLRKGDPILVETRPPPPKTHASRERNRLRPSRSPGLRRQAPDRGARRASPRTRRG